jgi:CheY-like chemotaxis protein
VSNRVLFVDDESNVLEAIQRTLRKHVELRTAASGAEGLRLLREEGPFALIISDMRMPLMSGAEFLAQARECAPDTVRMILSGHADQPATVAAVNRGQIFRFLNKPCPTDQLLVAIEDGLRQHCLLTAEKVLLEQTLSGAVKMLIEILGMVCPAASNRASRLQQYTLMLSGALGLSDGWEYGLAALLSQIGCVALPKDLLAKIEVDQPQTDEERTLYESHPEVAGKLLAAIPRLENVAAIVTAQSRAPSRAGLPGDLLLWDLRNIGQLLLWTSVEFDRLVSRGASREAALQTLGSSKYDLPAAMSKALASLQVRNQKLVLRQIRVKDLLAGMILDEDLFSPKGIRLVPAGQEVTRSLIVRLTSIAGGVGVSEPFRALVAV